MTPPTLRTLIDVLAALAQAGTDHALFGGLVAACHGRARPTWDVDVLIAGSAMDAAARGMAARSYAVQRFDHLAKFHAHRDEATGGDFLAHEINGILRAAFASRVPAVVLGQEVKIVSAAAFVALKFEAASTTARRPSDRARDVADIAGVLERGFSPADEALATAMAGLTRPGAAGDLAVFLAEVRQGRMPELARRAARRPRLLMSAALARSRRARR